MGYFVLCAIAGIPILAGKWASCATINHNGKIREIIRNAEMVAYADAAVVFWDGISGGAKNMIDLMEKVGKLTLVCMFNEVNENNPVFSY